MDPTARATRRYYLVLVPVMAIFLGGGLAIDWLRDMETPGEILAALALVPIAALLSTFWLQWRFIRDLDEYLQLLHVKALLIGAALALGVGTGWGFFEAIAGVPALWVFWLNPLFWVTYSLAVVFFSVRDGRGVA